MTTENDVREYPRKGINIRKSTVDMLDKFCGDHKISRTGLLEELATALVLGETRFFTIEPLDNTGLAYLHPNAANSWMILIEKVEDLANEFQISMPDEATKDFYDAASQLGVSRKQADKVLPKVLASLCAKEPDGEE